jgi:glycosyltransferase involved in cell wall biosynthesis
LFSCWDKREIHNLFTDQAFQDEFQGKQNYTLAQIPYHSGFKYSIPFFLGLIPEWRNNFSQKWLKKKVKEIKPELIYTFVYSSTTLHFSTLLAKLTKLPFVFHIGDDITQEENGETVIRKALQYAKRQFVISDNMKRYYESIFNRDFDTFHFVSTEIRPSNNSLESVVLNHQPKVIRFIGSYHKIQHEDAVVDLTDVLERINTPNVKFNLEFWGTETPLNALSGITKTEIYKGLFPERKKLSLIKGSDLLIIPSTFEENTHRYYKNSFPTKLTEYLLSGVPVLVYGPPDSSASIFCKRYSTGFTLTTKCKDKIAEFLLDFIENHNKYRLKARNDSIQLARDLADINMHGKFKNLLQS